MIFDYAKFEMIKTTVQVLSIEKWLSKPQSLIFPS